MKLSRFRLKNMSIKNKITVGFGVLIIFLFLVVTKSLFQMDDLLDKSADREKDLKDIVFLSEKQFDHMRLSAKISRAMLSETKLKAKKDPRVCSFGKWLYKNLEDNKHSKLEMEAMRAVEPAHARLHHNVKYIMENYINVKSNLTQILDQRWMDHLEWVRELQAMFITGKRFSGGLDPRKCELGRWYYSYTPENETFGKLIAKWETPHLALHRSAEKILAAWDAGDKGGAEQIYLMETLPALNSVREKYRESLVFLNGVKTKKKEMYDRYKTDIVPSMKKAMTAFDNLKKIFGDRAQMETEKSHAESKNSMILIVIMGVFAAAISVFFGVFISKSIISSVSKVNVELINNSKNLASLSGESVKSGDEMAKSAQEQAAATQESMASMQEMKSMINQTAEFAKKSQELANVVKEKTNSGDVIMNQLARSMGDIGTANENLKNMINIIGDISAKTEIINDIVFKTQLLSFNASIEAARAGTHGRGFSVVAEEIGKLANLSGKASLEIGELLKTSNKQVDSIVKSTKITIEEGQTVSDQAVVIFKEISDNISSITMQIDQVAQAAGEQAQGIEQTSQSITMLGDEATNNSEIAKNMSYSAEKLKDLSSKITRSITSLKVVVEGEK